MDSHRPTSLYADESAATAAAQDAQKRLVALMDRTGYPMIQDNGQRRYGPPPDWTGGPPPKGCEVFIGRLPRDVYEDELVPFLEQAGRLYEVRLMMDFAGSNRGYGFATYSCREEAKKAVRELDDREIRAGWRVGVCVSLDNCRLFVGGIPRERSRQEVLDEMQRLTRGVVDVILYPCLADRSRNRGFAFVEYTDHRAAAVARRQMVPGKMTLWGCHEVAVDWAEPEPVVDEETMQKGCPLPCTSSRSSPCCSGWPKTPRLAVSRYLEGSRATSRCLPTQTTSPWQSQMKPLLRGFWLSWRCTAGPAGRVSIAQRPKSSAWGGHLRRHG